MNAPTIFSSAPVRASDVIGTSVVNPEGQSLGSIKEFVIDPHSAKVAYAVVSFGGFLGLGEKLFAIPFSAFQYNMTKNEYVLAASKDLLDAASGFDPDHWPTMSDETWNRNLYAHYQRKPYWE